MNEYIERLDEANKISLKVSGILQNPDGSWNYSGYEAMMIFQQLQLKYPDYIEIVRCDDANHSNASLVFVHRKLDVQEHSQHFGVDIYFVPQTTGENPIKFNMSPHDVSHLMYISSKIVREMIDLGIGDG